MKKLPRLCMFCGKDETYGPMNREDFVPIGLWEKGHRPPHVRKVPSHVSCNGSFSQDNEYFRDVLAMDAAASSKSVAAQKVSEGAIHRKFQKKFGSIAKTLRNVKVRPVETRSGIIVDYRPSFEVDASRIERVLFNVMKGIYFTASSQPMPSDFVPVRLQDVRWIADPKPVNRLISEMVPWQDFGDEAFRCRYRFHCHPETVGIDCLLEFYGNRCYFGQARSPEYLQRRMENAFVPSKPESPILIPFWAVD